VITNYNGDCGYLGSLHLGGTWFKIIELTLEAKNALLEMFVALLVVPKSLKNGHLLYYIKDKNVDLDLREGLPNIINRRLHFLSLQSVS